MNRTVVTLQELSSALSLIALILLSGNSNAQNSFVILPFQQVKKGIYIQGTVEGKAGNFIVDTGYKGVLLNAKYFRGTPTDRSIRGINGFGRQVQEKYVDLQFDQVKCSNLHAEITNLIHLERHFGIRIDGLLGIDFFKEYELIIDYLNSELTLIQLDHKGRKVEQLGFYTPPHHVIPFKQKGYLPILEIQVDQQVIRCMVDTGAESNVLTPKAVKQLNTHIRNQNSARIYGVGGKPVEVSIGTLINASLNEVPLAPMRALFMHIIQNKELKGPYLHGILGYEFLKQQKIGINLRKREFYFWDDEDIRKENQEALVKKQKN